MDGDDDHTITTEPRARNGVGPEIVGSRVREERLRQKIGVRELARRIGHVVEGRLGLTIAFDTYELGPGDSVSFESSMPHRLFAIGGVPVVAIWFVVGRRGDPRIVRTT